MGAIEIADIEDKMIETARGLGLKRHDDLHNDGSASAVSGDLRSNIENLSAPERSKPEWPQRFGLARWLTLNAYGCEWLATRKR
jgi:hypothetical protein